jgi:hypothetical protein
LRVVCKNARSRPEIHLEDAIGNYECSIVTRALFAQDGVMLHSSRKNDLLQILEALPQRQTTAPENDREQAIAPDNDMGQATTPDDEREMIDTQTHVKQSRVAVVDGILELQALDKPTWIRNCSDMAMHFYSRINRKCQEYEEVHLVFDRYDVSRSLKSATRDTRYYQPLHEEAHITRKD